MFPKEYIATREIKSCFNHSYILVLQPIDNALSISLTDADTCLAGAIKQDAFVSIATTLQCSLGKVVEYLSISVRENHLEYNDTSKLLTFKIARENKKTELSTSLKLIDNATERTAKIKDILFLLANKINFQLPAERQHQPTSALHGYKINVTQNSKVSKAKRSCPGMSIINPSSKRVKSKPGVQFDNDSDDSDS